MSSKKKKGRPPSEGNGIGAVTPEGWHTRSEAARLVGRDPDTLKAWHRKARAGDPAYNAAVPSGQMKAGRLNVWLYSDQDIIDLRTFAANQKSGRRPGGRVA